MAETFAQALDRLWPHGDDKIPGLRAGIVRSSPAVFAKYGIDTRTVLAHLMAQISHECGAGLEVVENLNYSAERLIEVWPRHFSSANAGAYAHNPQRLGDFIYNPPQHTDLGNRAGSDDGFLYRGRGGAQTTGRANYARLADLTGFDLLAKPDLVNDPDKFLACAVADFVACGCLPYAEADDVVGVTKRLNGGTIGLAERKEWLAKWKAADVAPPLAGSPAPAPVPAKQPSFLDIIISFILSIFGRK